MAQVDCIVADLDLLRATATRLGQIANDLTASRASADADAQVLAQPDVAAALGEFSDNWKLHRENLISAVQGAHTFMTTAVDCYVKADQGLADAATPDGGK